MCSEAEHRLFTVIFSNYNQYIRPVENVSDPVIVQFEVSMSQLVKVVSAWKGKSKDKSVSILSRFYSLFIYIQIAL